MANDNKAEIVLAAVNKTGAAFDSVKANFKSLTAESAAMSGVLAKTGGVLAGIGAGFASAALLAQIRSVANGLDALNDIADVTGSSIENISSLEQTALKTGASLDTVSTSLIKMNQVLNGAKAGSQIDLDLKAIGLSAKELKAQDPADALITLAQALDNFAEDGDKARVVQDLFGKSVREVGPLLKDLAERGKENATVTEDQAKQAEKFNQQLAEMETRFLNIKRAIFGEALPAINKWLDRVQNMPKNLDSIFLSDGAEYDAKQVSDTVSMIETFTEALKKDPTNPAYKQRLVELREEYTRLSKQAASTSDQLKKLNDVPYGAGSGRGFVNPSKSDGVIKASLTVGDAEALKRDEEAARRAQEAYDKLIGSINSKIDTQRQELALGRDLTASEKFIADKAEEIAQNTSRLGDAQRKKAKAYLEAHAAIIKANDAELRGLQVSQQTVQALLQQSGALRKSNDDLDFQISLIGQTEQAQRDLTTTRQLDLAQQEISKNKEKALFADDSVRQALEATNEELERQIDLLIKHAQAVDGTKKDSLAGATRGVNEYLESIRNYGEATQNATENALRNTEDALTNFLATGKDGTKALIDSMLADFFRLKVVRPLIDNLFGGSSGAGLASMFAAMFGGGGGAASAGWNSQLGGDLTLAFGGARAGGGSIDAGKTYLVGEKGPELLTSRQPGWIVPNTGLTRLGAGSGSVNIVQNVSVGAGVSRSEVQAAMNVAKEQAKAEIMQSKRHNGAFS